jgi:hypothetical protein
MFDNMLQDHVGDPDTNDGELDRGDVITIVQEALREMQRAEKHQQDKDRIAFAVVVGAGVAAGSPGFQMANSDGRERAYTGLLKVGGDVLSFISTFVSREKVKLQCEWTVPGGGKVGSCHVSPCSTMICEWP